MPTIFSPIVGVLSALSLYFIVQFLAFISFFSLIVSFILLILGACNFNCDNHILCSCFTTEILEGFDVQRTSGLADTLRKYGYITQAITEYYKVELPEDQLKCAAVCPPFDEFLKRCQDLDKMTVSDVFAVQLMQVMVILVRRIDNPINDAVFIVIKVNLLFEKLYKSEHEYCCFLEKWMFIACVTLRLIICWLIFAT